MSIKQIAISSFAKLILGSQVWADVRHLVSSIEPANHLSGAEKRHSVFTDLQKIASDVTNILLNLAIELAVVWIKGINV